MLIYHNLLHSILQELNHDHSCDFLQYVLHFLEIFLQIILLFPNQKTDYNFLLGGLYDHTVISFLSEEQICV